MDVTATAKITSASDRQYVFEVEARDSRDVVGKGTHTRVVVTQDKFQANADKKLE